MNNLNQRYTKEEKMPEFQGKKNPYTSSGYRQMMKDKKAVGAGMKKGGRSQKLMKGGMKKTKKKK